MNEQEKFFRHVLSEIRLLRHAADTVALRAATMEKIATDLETTIKIEGDRLGIEIEEE